MKTRVIGIVICLITLSHNVIASEIVNVDRQSWNTIIIPQPANRNIIQSTQVVTAAVASIPAVQTFLQRAGPAVQQAGYKVTGQLQQIWSSKNLFFNWVKNTQSLSRINNPLSHNEARQLIENAKTLGFNVRLTEAGIRGLEITGKWKGIVHFHINNLHIPVEPGFKP